MGKTFRIDAVFEDGSFVQSRPFSLMLKPVGGACNLNCAYCYYKGGHQAGRMDMGQLEALFGNYADSQPAGAPLTFIWHGGEPLLAGEEFFRKAVGLQRRMFSLQGRAEKGPRQVANILQTNATAVTESLAGFLAENNFLCGVSIDGPEALHDIPRKTVAGGGSWKQTMHGLRLLQHAGVQINAMVAVGGHNVAYPGLVYGFLKDAGLEYIQLLPVAEGPSGWLEGEDWGDFLCGVFDLWRISDIGKIFVNYFDNTLALHVGMEPDLCFFCRSCPPCPSAETGGEVYACDHLSRPLGGNVFNDPLSVIMSSRQEYSHETEKYLSLSGKCRSCPYLRLCNRDCPVHRTVMFENGERISSLCPGYRKYFAYTYDFFSQWAASIVVGQRH